MPSASTSPAGFGLAGLRAGGVPDVPGLPAVLVLGEHERERDVGVVVAVGVDVDPVDRAGVELRAGDRGRDRRRGAGRVRVHDQHGRAGVVTVQQGVVMFRAGGRREDEHVGEVQAAVVAGELEVVGAEVVRHGVFFLLGSGVARVGGQLRMKSSRAVLTWSAWVQGMACGPPSMTTSRTSLIRPGSRLPVLSSGRTWSASPWTTRIGHVDLGEVGAEVGRPGRDAGHRGGSRRGDGQVPAGLPGLVADQGAAQGIEVVEVVQETLHPRRGVGLGGLDEPVEQALRHPFDVVGRLQQERGDRGDQHPLGYPGRAAGAQIPRDLAGAHRVPDQDGVVQVEVVQQGSSGRRRRCRSHSR